jgi:hypothetical protein
MQHVFGSPYVVYPLRRQLTAFRFKT